MLAITTKFIPASNTRGDRVKASYAGKSITTGWDYALDTVENHKEAAQALERKMASNPDGLGRQFYNYVGGSNQDGSFTWIALETANHKFTG